MKTFLILSCVALAVIAAPGAKDAKPSEKTKRHLGDNLRYYDSLPQAYSAPLLDNTIVLANPAQYYSAPVVRQELAQHTVHNVINKVPIAIPQPIAVPITKTVKVAQPYPVAVEKPLPVQVRVNVPYAVEKPYAVQVPQPIPYQVRVKVPYAVEKPYPVAITKTVPVAVEKPVYVKVPEVIKVPVAQPYPVAVQRKVAVTVPEPIVVKVPELINVHHNVYKQPVIRQQVIEQVNLPVYSQQLYGQEYGLSSGIQSEVISGELLSSQPAPPCPFSHNQESLVSYGSLGSYGKHNIFARNTEKKH